MMLCQSSTWLAASKVSPLQLHKNYFLSQCGEPKKIFVLFYPNLTIEAEKMMGWNNLLAAMFNSQTTRTRSIDGKVGGSEASFWRVSGMTLRLIRSPAALISSFLTAFKIIAARAMQVHAMHSEAGLTFFFWTNLPNNSSLIFLEALQCQFF